MRNILFRGIGIKSREWVYGAYVPAMDEDSCDSIIDEQGEQHIVFSDTVGQYTGLKDRYGDRIWEGDLVKHGDEVSEVFFDTENSCFDFKASNDPFAAQFFCDYEILGNIHDNPELLK